MILGSGIDIVEISRMKDAIEKWGDNFLKKMFTDREIGYANSMRFACQHLAARFAAKEAVVKAFGQPKKFPIRWTEIEILKDAEGKPIVEFHKAALKQKKRKKVDDVILSMSHSRNYAVANVILLSR